MAVEPGLERETPTVSPASPRPSAPARDRRAALAVGLAVFTSGGVLLAVEIAASRVLAPFFGNSLFVWGALIGVVLAGLSLGYWAGGALADRFPAPDLLVSIIGAAALAILAVPFADEPVLEAVVEWNPGPRLNPLVAAIALFGLPSVLLGGATPVAVRLRARSVAHVGRTAGRLFAVSTAGSIAGTFAAAFWLIPEFGTNQLLALAAGTLLVAVAAVALAERMLVPAVLALAATIASAATFVAVAPERGETLSRAEAQNWSPLYRLRARERRGTGDLRTANEQSGFRVVYAKETRYHRLAVVDDGDSRYLRFDNSFQSGMYLSDPFRTRYRYTDLFQLGLAYNPRARNVLFIGLGGGSAPKRMWRDFPRLQVEVVELDPVVVDVGYRLFGVPKDGRLRVHVDDGRRFLARSERRWDVIAIDAFYADSLPFHLTTREFLELVRSRLAPGGVVLSNAIGALTGQDSKLFRSLYRTYRSAFPTVAVHPTILPDEGGLDTVRNLIIVSTEQAAPRPRFLVERWQRLRERAPTAPGLTKPILDRYDRPIPTQDVPTLTDDYAPTDALLFID